MFCSKCGKSLPENSKFCANCGTPVQNGTPEARQTGADTGRSGNGGSGSLFPIIIAAAVGVLIISGAAAFFVFSKKGESGGGTANVEVQTEQQSASENTPAAEEEPQAEDQAAEEEVAEDLDPLYDPEAYILPESADRELTSSDLEGLSGLRLTYARNEIFARHGYVFKSDELNKYFACKSWYTANNAFNGVLEGVEMKNADFIKAYQDDPENWFWIGLETNYEPAKNVPVQGNDAVLARTFVTENLSGYFDYASISGGEWASGEELKTDIAAYLMSGKMDWINLYERKDLAEDPRFDPSDENAIYRSYGGRVAPYDGKNKALIEAEGKRLFGKGFQADPSHRPDSARGYGFLPVSTDEVYILDWMADTGDWSSDGEVTDVQEEDGAFVVQYVSKTYLPKSDADGYYEGEEEQDRRTYTIRMRKGGESFIIESIQF